jgi:hypothetical protein
VLYKAWKDTVFMFYKEWNSTKEGKSVLKSLVRGDFHTISLILFRLTYNTINSANDNKNSYIESMGA